MANTPGIGALDQSIARAQRSSTAVELAASCREADAAMARYIEERLRPLAGLPDLLHFTVHAGQGKISVQRVPPPIRGNGIS